jgi:uracil-DNA glycosylase
MSVKLEESWLKLLADQFEQPYFKQIKAKLLQEHAEHHVVYPPGPQIFAALDYCPVDKVKAVIIGQDPYHNPGQAHGLCFSVPFGIEPPPSLVNIFQELHDDLGITPPPHGNLEGWAHQGILLLNASLTVRAHMAASHAGIGWQQFTDTIIQRLSQVRENLVFRHTGGQVLEDVVYRDSQPADALRKKFFALHGPALLLDFVATSLALIALALPPPRPPESP